MTTTTLRMYDTLMNFVLLYLTYPRWAQMPGLMFLSRVSIHYCSFLHFSCLSRPPVGSHHFTSLHIICCLQYLFLIFLFFYSSMSRIQYCIRKTRLCIMSEYPDFVSARETIALVFSEELGLSHG